MPPGTEVARPFLPAREFALSRAFYRTLGFSLLLDAQVAIFAAGQECFFPVEPFQKDRA